MPVTQNPPLGRRGTGAGTIGCLILGVCSLALIGAAPAPADPQQPATNAAAPNHSAWQAAPADQQLDLVALASAYADALGDQELAAANLAKAEAINSKQAGAIDPLEIHRLQVGVKTADRKIALFEGLAKAALMAAAEERHALLAQRAQHAGDAQQSAFLMRKAQLDGRIQMLKLILESK